jgi:hypothetical protein
VFLSIYAFFKFIYGHYRNNYKIFTETSEPILAGIVLFRFIWPSGFRGEDFLKIGQSETRISYGSHVLLKLDKAALFEANIGSKCNCRGINISS